MKRTHSCAATIHLIGDWTITGVVKQVSHLTGLHNSGARPGDPVAIDCSGIAGIDLNGFQLLSVWLHCIQLSGLRPKLVNVPNTMREAQKRQGITQLLDNELQERG